MPFGIVFSAIVFGVLAPWLGVSFLAGPGLPARLSGACLALLGLSLASAMVAGKRWSRWAGLAGLFWVAMASMGHIVRGGEILGMLSLFAAAIAVPLLLVPRTGRMPDEESGSGRSRWLGPVLATTTVVSLIGLVVAGLLPARSTGPASAAMFSSASGQDLTWLDFAPGLEQARADGKPVLVDFFAEWCGPCHQMDRVTFRDARVVGLLREAVIPVRVDSEEEEPRHGVSGYELAERYDVMTYPTLALLDGNGRVIARASGYFGPDRFLGWLEDALDRVPESRTTVGEANPVSGT